MLQAYACKVSATSIVAPLLRAHAALSRSMTANLPVVAAFDIRHLLSDPFPPISAKLLQDERRSLRLGTRTV